jgi:quercetin dioxygenase-like cupin family protein
MVTLVLLFFAALISRVVFAAEDIVKVAPANCKVVLENENVRVIEYKAKVGEKVGMHSHPNHIVYILTASGATKFTMEDGKSEVREMKQGEAVWVPATTHATENVGSTDTQVLIVEMKK